MQDDYRRTGAVPTRPSAGSLLVRSTAAGQSDMARRSGGPQRSPFGNGKTAEPGLQVGEVDGAGVEHLRQFGVDP